MLMDAVKVWRGTRVNILTDAELINPAEKINILRQYDSESVAPHLHEFIEIVYIASGCGTHQIGDRFYHASRGDLLFINLHQTHAFTVDKPMTYYNILLKPELVNGDLINSENVYEIFAMSLLEEFGGDVDSAAPFISFRGEELVEIEMLIESMHREFVEKKIGYKSAVNGYIHVLLAKMYRYMCATKNKKNVAEYIGKIAPEILQYIEDNCAEKLSLSELAAKCFYTPSYFSRVFKECYGKTPTQYIQEKRIKKSMKLLSESRLPVWKISEMVGYTDKKLFYKLFREIVGTTPNEFRAQSQK